jgi:hypothetical protein
MIVYYTLTITVTNDTVLYTTNMVTVNSGTIEITSRILPLKWLFNVFVQYILNLLLYQDFKQFFLISCYI